MEPAPRVELGTAALQKQHPTAGVLPAWFESTEVVYEAGGPMPLTG